MHSRLYQCPFTELRTVELVEFEDVALEDVGNDPMKKSELARWVVMQG